jgi:hypothetical protein
MKQKVFSLKQAKAKPFVALKVSDKVVKLISVWEISKIIVNKERLEITVLLTSGDKDIIKFRSLSALESALVSLYTVYGGVFLAP